MSQAALQTAPNSGLPVAGMLGRKRRSIEDILRILQGGTRLSLDAIAGMLDKPERKTLYVNRPLKNAAELIEWARAAGFKKTLPAGDLHVTLAYSKTPVEWDAIDDAPDAVVVPTGVREIEPLGDEGAVVLRFESEELQDRWQALCNAGAKWDYDGYKPHVTITWDAGDFNYSTIEPFNGVLEFGPEEFAEVDPDAVEKAKARLAVATDSALTLALDKDSVRSFDRDGRLRVARTHISKANICPYKGSEIPDWQKLGLEPDRIYQLYRDPEELQKAAATLNGVPLLRKHIPVSADDHQPHDVVGSLGTDAEFDGEYLDNSVFVNAREAIEGIESGKKRELSAGYHYVPDMTPGNIRGNAYDGVMRQIHFNHVALVEDGRAGPDVVVGDSNEEIVAMSNRTLAESIAAIANRTVSVQALSLYLRPRLAMDAKPIGMAKIFEGVTGKNFKEQKPVIAKRIRDLAKPQLAKDASLDDVEKVLDMLDAHEIEGTDVSVSPEQHNAMEAAAHGNSTLDIPAAVGKEFVSKDNSEGLRGFLKEKGMGEDDIAAAANLAFPPKPAIDEEGGKEGETEEEKREREERKSLEDKQAKDEDDEEAKKKAAAEKAAKDAAMKDMVTKPAMDAAIKLATDAAVKTARTTERGIRAALDEVRPYVGSLSASLAFDSAADVVRHALKMLGVDGADKITDEYALKAVLAAQPKAGAKPLPTLGMDAAQVTDFAKMFPEAMRIQPGR